MPFITLGAAWKADADKRYVISGPADDAFCLLTGLPVGTKIQVYRNDKDGHDARPDYRIVLATPDGQQRDASNGGAGRFGDDGDDPFKDQ